ncbi:DUF502 domain-containing protein [Rubritalea tangerina]|uniref:DUF502 domain-containing protein n=2 Tax=Rubritalea tangerina TaxID=430798 RepID=A0ABW4ZCD3_9BACT
MEMEVSKNSPWVRISKRILAGAAAVGPMVGTLWLLYVIYKLLLRIGDSMVSFIWNMLQRFSGVEAAVPSFPGIGLLHFLLPLFLLFAAGVVLKRSGGRRTLRGLESVLKRLPLVGLIYTSLVQFVDAIQGLGGERKFKSVVYVEYPSPGCRLIGFVTGEFQENEECEGVTSVFVPTSPNPLTGFLILIDNDKIQPCEMSVEQASKMVLSAGLVTPEK